MKMPKNNGVFTRATREAVALVLRACRYLKQKNWEASEMEIRAMKAIEERHSQNWHSIRRDRW